MDDMMWEITKKCWKMASDDFGDKIFVDIPSRLKSSGKCPIVSLDGEHLGDISYASVSGDQPFFTFSLKNEKSRVSIPRFASVEFPAIRQINAEKIKARYGEAIPQITALVRASSIPLTEGSVCRWMIQNGFAGCNSNAVLAELGVKTAKRLFEEMEKIRINNPDSMEHNEGGRILKYKRIEGHFVYLVQVDGSTDPKWFAEKHLSKNSVGEVPYRTSLPRTNAE